VRFMWFKRLIFILAGIFCGYGSFAQLQKGELVQSRILILLDESSSMIQSWADGKEKYKAADELILKLMDSVYAVNNQVEISLRVFGHQSTVQENNCYDTKMEVPYAKDNRVQMALRLADIHPLGVTPIAYSLQQAADHDLDDPVHHVYSIILITDGGESCGGDICAVMAKLKKERIFFKPYIVSLENDPTLKTTYACMGDYLQVTSERQIPGAVSTIVEAFRPALKINTDEYKEVQDIAASAPSVLKVSTPPIPPGKPAVKIWKKPAAEGFAEIEPVHLNIIAIPAPTAKKITPFEANIKLPAIPHAAVRVSEIQAVGLIKFSASLPAPVRAKAADVPPLPALVIELPPPAPKPEKVAKIIPEGVKKFNVIYVIEDHTLPLIGIPPLPPVKIDPTLVKPRPSRPLPTATKQINYKVETEDNTETTVEIYFTNGHGKFYTTMPQVLLTDPATGGIVKKFYRTVDADGNPDPQPDIPPGNYDLAFTAKHNLVIHNIAVQKNKKNKVTVTVNMTSLSFAYIDAVNTDNLSDRPVTEFTAVVTERDKAQGRVQVQKCTDAIQYEPGNYHIEINTFPKEIRNVDLDFDDVSVIRIAQPGFAKFTASDPKTRYITLYQRLGDKFLSFHTLDLSDPASRHLSMQPGEYQAHYQKGPGQSAASEQVVPFLVKATAETEVMIK
jgi:hypothetical protein